MNEALKDFVLKDPKFRNCSGSASPGRHHYGIGGLKKHTFEVIQSCKLMAEQYGLSEEDKEDLMYAALYHDIGKTYDYTDDPIEKAPHYYLVHHIVRSALIWDEQAKKHEYPEERREKVLHAILAHHQLREWGSPVEPKTKIAWILHLADNVSARMDDGGQGK